MVKINNIKLSNFRNFQSCEISFNGRCNVLFGENGSGKTNILESISLLGKGRGFRNANINNLIFKNENDFFIESLCNINENNYNIKIYNKLLNQNNKKITSLNDEISKDSSNFINDYISFLFFLPEMERLFLASPNYRRNFLDKLIFSENKNYNKLVNKYKKNLIERTKLLQRQNYDNSWIKKIEIEISNTGIEIYNFRNKQVDILNKYLLLINEDNKYPFKIHYQIEDTFLTNPLNIDNYLLSLMQNRIYDTKFGGSKIGPHKSDIKVNINDDFESSQLSTGQQKTIVLMTLFAQSTYLVKEKNLKPILLFDEICSHLDKVNRQILLELLNQFDIQYFLTGTDKSLFSFISTNAEFYNITNI